MHTQLDCLPCYLRQALDAARQVTDNENVQRAVLHQVCHALHLIDARRSPPATAQQIHRIIRATLGDEQADVIIAKGQGNYESLAGTPGRPIHFLFIPKCPLVARHAGAPENMLVIRSPDARARIHPELPAASQSGR